MMSVAKSSICNPAAAPYDGATAVQVMKAPGVSAAIQPGADAASITHADRSETGNAELGFVAPPELTNSKTRLRWLVAREFHSPMGQDAVLLESGADNKGTRTFVDFLKRQKLHAIIAGGGYVQS
ncbi:MULTISPECIES: substrate-binding domain-containing protein [unclassified Bradyrhizobium]